MTSHAAGLGVAARNELRAALAAALVTLVAGIATMSPHLVGVFFDDAIYVLLGKAIAEGHGYVYTQLPGTPPGIHYPPVWPALLALVWKVGPEFPGTVLWLKAVNPILLAGAAFGGVLVAVRHFGFPAWVAGIAVAGGTASIPLLVLTNVVLSEPVFLALLFPALLAAVRCQRDGGWPWALAAAVLAALLVLTRTIGGVVVIATLLALAHERRWREGAFYAAVVALCILPWQLFVWRHSPDFPDLLRGSYGPYLEWVLNGYREGGTELLRGVLAKNLGDAWRSTGAMLTPMLPGAPRVLATVLALALFVVGGLASLARRETRILALALGGYLVLVAVWPFQTERFIWGLWPVFLLTGLAGARTLVRAVRSARAPWAPRAVLAAAALLAIGHMTYNVRGLSRGWAGSAARQMSERAERLVTYINSDPRLEGRVIATESDPVVALYTGRTVVPVEILQTRDHIVEKTTAARAVDIARFDRAYRPDAYVLMPEGVHVAALLTAPLDSTRRLVEITPPGLGVRSFLVLTQ